MTDYQEELKIAEMYLDEMLEADRRGDYLAFIKRFESVDSESFNEDVFSKDVELMREDLGEYKERLYFGMLHPSNENGAEESFRFVWRGIYEKNEALIVLGIHKKNDTWFVNENHIS